jgi:hypothetical protein
MQSASIQLLLAGAIDQAKEAGSNSTNIPALESILSAAQEMHQMLLATAPADAIGEKALSFRAGVANWWTHEHVSILSRSFDMGLFTALVGICVLAGVLPATIAATLVRPKEIVEALKEVGKLLTGETPKK